MATRKPPTKNTADFAAWCADAVPDGVVVQVTQYLYYSKNGPSRYTTNLTSLAVSRGDHRERYESGSLEDLAVWLVRIGIPRLFPRELAEAQMTVKATVKPAAAKPVRHLTKSVPKLTHAVRALPAPPAPGPPRVWG